MIALIFFYNLLITLTFVILALSFLQLYRLKHKSIYVWICVMFGCFFGDNLLVYMHELLPGFSDYYTATTIHYYLGSIIGILILFSYRRILLADANCSISRRELFCWLALLLLTLFLCIPALGCPRKLRTVLSALISLTVFSLGLYTRLKQRQQHYHIGLPLVAISLALQLWEALERLLDGFGLDLWISDRYLSVEVLSILFSGFGIHHLCLLSKEQNNAPLPKPTEFGLQLDTFRQRLGLTQREQEVLTLLVQGLSNREIGEKLFISEGTVKTHIHNIYQKAGVSSRLQLMKVLSDHSAPLRQT